MEECIIGDNIGSECLGSAGLWNCLPSFLLPFYEVRCGVGGCSLPKGQILWPAVSQASVETVSFSDYSGLFIYCACLRKPLFLLRNVLPILVGPDFVHFCLGASKTMFWKRSN